MYKVKYYGHYRWPYEQGLMHGYEGCYDGECNRLSLVCSI